LRLVSRENLEQVYQKVWKDGAKGDLGHFLGIAVAPAPAKSADAAPAPAPAAAGAPAAAPTAPSGVSKESTSASTIDSKDVRD
jgi:hypothetical protein